MTTPLSGKTIALVKATVPALTEHGATITGVMYKRLFETDHIRALFNQANQESGAQVKALAGGILAYARNIDNLGALGALVERMAQKHVGYHILPEHYPYVASALLGAIKEVLGDAATDEILDAWGEAYWFLAAILQGRETDIRQSVEAQEGGWSGWRAFVVEQKIRESAVITSFVLRPQDGGKVVAHKPGQFLTFAFDTAVQKGVKRNYSISQAANGETYRISVKRETHGVASGHLHDAIQVGDVLVATPPAGDFHLKPAERPVVLLSGGVGLTPMVAMLEAIAADHPDLEAYFVHGALNGDVHALGEQVKALAAAHGGTRVSTFFSEPAAGDVLGDSHDVEGFVSIDWLKAETPFDTADFYLCGPKPFLRSLVQGLILAGVPVDRIHYEFFGPADELLAA